MVDAIDSDIQMPTGTGRKPNFNGAKTIAQMQLDKAKALVGKRFGFLVVKDIQISSRKENLLNCLCDCGNTRFARYSEIKANFYASCGCMRELTRMQKKRDDAIKSGKYFGVKANGAKFEVKCKRKYIGIFETAEEAAKAYDKAAFETYGNEAVFNFPEDWI